jgi:hypothetical protein
MKKYILTLALIAFAYLIQAQVSYSDALNLVQSKAKNMGGEVSYYKVSNLGNSNKKEYWFMIVYFDGGACLASVPETSLKAQYKCVNPSEVGNLAEVFGAIPEYFDAEAHKKQLEIEKKQQIELEKRLAEEAKQKKIKSDRELPIVLKKLDNFLASRDTLSIISELEALKNSELINGKENEINHQKLQKFIDLKNVYNEKIRLQKLAIEKENARIEKEKERVRLENERIEKEKEEERVRIENERLEKERILSYTTNTILIKNLEIANHDFPSEMYYKEAISACAALGEGWRLPTKDELKTIYKKQAKIKNFSNLAYWTSMDHNDYIAWTINIAGENMGSYRINEIPRDIGNVWAVRTAN